MHAVAHLPALMLAVGLGILVALAPQAAIVLLAAVLGVFALTVPASGWVGAALVAALTSRGLVAIGLLPSIAAFLDIPLAWGALAAALLRRDKQTGETPAQLKLLFALAATTAFSWLLVGVEVSRAVLYLALLGEPFAIFAALLLDPPTKTAARRLMILVGTLVGLQLPVAAYQALQLGLGDPVQGTMSSPGGGAHNLGAIVAMAILWVVSSSRRERFVLAPILLLIPVIADAKQVLVLLPLGLLAALGLRGGRRLVRLGQVVALAGVAFVLLVRLSPTGQSVVPTIQSSPLRTKIAVAELVLADISSSPAKVLFGEGPGETVSRTAFLIVEASRNPLAPLRILDLTQSSLPLEADARARTVAGSFQDTSINSGTSSALGVLGDLGLAGLGVYVLLLLSLGLAIWRGRSAISAAARGSLTMFAALGLVFDWWEQPPVAVMVGLLTGLAATEQSRVTSRIRLPTP